MTTSTLATVKNGTIILPKVLRKAWQNSEVYISGGENNIFIKKLERPMLSQMLGEFQQMGKKITRKDVNEAIRAVRRRRS